MNDFGANCRQVSQLMQVASTKKLPSIFVESRLAASAIPFPLCATAGPAAYLSIIHTLQTETNPLLFHASPSISSKLQKIHHGITLSVNPYNLTIRRQIVRPSCNHRIFLR